MIDIATTIVIYRYVMIDDKESCVCGAKQLSESKWGSEGGIWTKQSKL
jgi:hypothetical protein